MASISHTNRVIVTPKGVDLQVQLLRDAVSPNFRAPSPPLEFDFAYHPKTFRSTSSSSALPTYFFPKPGYFGPKPTPPSKHASISYSGCKDSVFYPNYLKREAKDYPQKHVCTWKPKSIIEGSNKIAEEAPHGKYMHHTLFNESVTRFNESPRVNQLNSLVLEKIMPSPKRSKSPKSPNNSTYKAAPMHSSQTSFYSPRMSSTGFSRFSTTSQRLDIKDERLVNKHIENEKNYQKLLVRFEDETRKRINRYQENQHEAPEFEKKMKEENHVLLDLDVVKTNEQARLAGRLKSLQKKKYEKTWKRHEEFLGKSGLISNRELKPSAKKEDARLFMPFNSARETPAVKELEKPMSVHSLVRSPTLTLTKKVSFFSEEVAKKPAVNLTQDTRRASKIVMKKFEIK